jgi:hypothetical protein
VGNGYGARATNFCSHTELTLTRGREPGEVSSIPWAPGSVCPVPAAPTFFPDGAMGLDDISACGQQHGAWV